MNDSLNEYNSETEKILWQNLLLDYQIEHFAKNDELIKPFNNNFLSGCSYDLCVGDIITSRHLESSFELDSEYIIQSGECITIKTLESVNFRKILFFGQIVNKHSILAKGLFHPITTIDPGFKGKLAITFINLGNIGHKIKKGDRIAKLIFIPVFPEPNNIYGVTQNPSYSEGSIDIALIVDKPTKQQRDDFNLSNMYGLPIKRLYEKIQELENKYETATLRNTAEKWDRRKKFFAGFLFALISGISGALLVLYWNDISNFL